MENLPFASIFFINLTYKIGGIIEHLVLKGGWFGYLLLEFRNSLPC